MPDRPTKSEMIDALEKAGITVPPTTTLSRLRQMSENLGVITAAPPTTDATAETAVEEDTYADARDEGTDDDAIEIPAALQETEAELDKKLLLLRKRQEVLMLQESISRLERAESLMPRGTQTFTSAATSTSRLTFKDIEHTIIKFDGESKARCVHDFLRNFERVMEMVSADDLFRYTSLCNSLTGTAKLILNKNALNYDHLKTMLIKEFGRIISRGEIYQSLTRYKWNKNESVRRYVLEMEGIAARCDCIDEFELIGFIIDGMQDNSPESHLLMNARTMDQFKDSLDLYERRRANRLNNNNKPEAAATARQKVPTSSRVHTKPEVADTKEVRCFNCTLMGHYQSKCPYEKRPENSCFRCWKTGHDHRSCPNPKKIPRIIKNTTAVVTGPRNAVTDCCSHEEEEPDDFSSAIDAINMVSVAYHVGRVKRKKFRKCLSLFDTGSPTNFIRKSDVPRPNNIGNIATKSKYTGLGKHKLMTYGKLKVEIKFKNRCEYVSLNVVPDETMAIPLILGREFLNMFNIHLCRINNLNSFNRNLVDKQLHFCAFDSNLISNSEVVEDHSVANEDKYQTTPVQLEGVRIVDDEVLREIMSIETEMVSTGVDVNPILNKQRSEELVEVIRNNYLEPIHVESKPYDYEMHIRLTNDMPFHSLPRRLSFYERNELRKITDDLLEKKIIRPSDSPYASAVVLVKKKNGEIRKCVDYRPLNKLTVRDNYPLPLIEDCIEYLGGKNYFTTLDLRNGFFHVKMAPDSVKYTAFVTPYGQFEYMRMPFGLKNAPAVFQRYIHNIFRDLVDSGLIIIYMDDIIAGTVDFESHLQLVAKVLRRMKESGLELRLNKCKFGYSDIEYLGYRVNLKGICPSDSHVEAIRQYPPPSNQREVKACLGLFSYFRKFIPNYARIARPLQQLTHDGVQFVFTEECERSFVELKSRLSSAPVLSIYDPLKQTELHCDASAAGFGAVLLQRQSDGKLHPVMYFSKATTASESRCHSFELETLAVIYALRRFDVYLDKVPFKIITDCNALILTLNKKQLNRKIGRWALELENYNYTIQHRGGVNMGHVDALSRCRSAGTADPVESLIGAVNDNTDDRDRQCRVVCTIDSDEVDFQIQATQNRDETIKQLRERLEKEEVIGYDLQDGLVFRKEKTGKLQLFVPSEMEGNVIRLVHEKIGHLGTAKTCDQLKKNYWFQKMTEKVDRFIRNCIRCIMCSAPARINEHNLHCIPKEPVPFDTIHLDHFGPLPSINSKRKHILVVIDAFTKYVRLYAVNSTSTKEVKFCLDKYFSYYSRPRRIITDRGSCFTSLEFDAYLLKHNISHVKVAVASPQANGQVERVNRVIKPMLSKMSEPINHANWSGLLSRVEYSLNNTVHSTTKQTPSKLLFGVEQRGELVDKFTEYLEEKQGASLKRDLEGMRSSASDAITKSQEYNLNYFLTRSKPAKTYTEGDFVVIRNIDTVVGTNKKFVPKYRGPYVVHKVLPHDRYIIRDIENCQLTQLPYDGVIEASRMRKWVVESSELNDPTQLDVGNTC